MCFQEKKNESEEVQRGFIEAFIQIGWLSLADTVSHMSELCVLYSFQR